MVRNKFEWFESILFLIIKDTLLVKMVNKICRLEINK